MEVPSVAGLSLTNTSNKGCEIYGLPIGSRKMVLQNNVTAIKKRYIYKG
jgi:hypothetical protein